LGKALARLTAAYLIHLDTEYDPPKENWQRFGQIAHALMESPLYVFYFLKQQERNGDLIGIDQVRRYIRYAETLFNDQGDVQMSHAKELVELYRGFYRAKTLKNANSILRPLSVIADALLIADNQLFGDETALVELAYGELYRFMDRVGKGLAEGRFPKGISVPEREQAMRRFCEKFVRDIFIGIFRQDVAALRGKQLNLLRSACEALYRDAQYAEWAARGKDADETDDDHDEA
jgi:CRISPR-associated protein Csc3